jgi:hypothetical protein
MPRKPWRVWRTSLRFRSVACAFAPYQETVPKGARAAQASAAAPIERDSRDSDGGVWGRKEGDFGAARDR